MKILDRWNDADTTLVCAAACFLMAVGFKIVYADSILAEGFLFVTEAAMVGGIADWFAVTALFKKPLGFPFHTAILPNRREEFITASVQMVQTEFFSRRTIFKKVGNLHLLPKLIEYLEKIDTKKFLLGELHGTIKNYISSLDKENLSKMLANKIRREFENIPVKTLIDTGGDWIKKNDKDREFFIGLMKKMREEAAKPETRTKLQNVLEEYAQQRTQSAGLFSMMMAGLAQMLDLVNFKEAAEIMQTQLLKFIDELIKDTPLQRKTLNECRLKISELTSTPEFKDLIIRLQVDLVSALPLEKAIQATLTNFESQIQSADFEKIFSSKKVSATEKNFGTLLIKILNQEYDKLLNFLKTDGDIKNAANNFIYELTARTALYAQPLVGTVAKSALDKMTAEKLNNTVYDKAEKDFIWIRMNGSIVGSFVGLMIFILIKLVS